MRISGDGHNDFVNHSNRELTKMAIAQWDTPEFKLMFFDAANA
jgi:hypothetical protein